MKFRIFSEGRRIASPKTEAQGRQILALLVAEFRAEGLPCPEYRLTSDKGVVARVGGVK